MLYRRHLPHVFATQQPVFLTWRLDGSLPPHRPFLGGTLSSGQEFAALDRLLDEARSGPVYLRQVDIAEMVAGALRYNSEVLKQYSLHAFVIMPNHVHVLVTARVPLPKMMKSLKGITGKRGNLILGLTGRAFWQEESYDHVVRNELEFRRIRWYIEENPVRAGLVHRASEYRWSSAWPESWVSGRDLGSTTRIPGTCEADQGVGCGRGGPPS